MKPSSLFTAVHRVAWGAPLTLAMTVSAIVIACIPQLAETLQFDRGLIHAGELWRLATCHLTHWNLEHFQWDLLMFMVLGTICELRHARQMRLCVLLSAASVSGIVLVALPSIANYRGLSGIDTALFTLLACSLLQNARRQKNHMMTFTTTTLLLAFIAKTAYEATMNRALFVNQTVAGFQLLVWDHVVAGLVGACVALAISAYLRKRLLQANKKVDHHRQPTHFCCVSGGET